MSKRALITLRRALRRIWASTSTGSSRKEHAMSDTSYSQVSDKEAENVRGEGKTKKALLVPGQLLCLEHAVQQEYFPKHDASLLHIFLSRNGGVLKSCGSARERLSSALERRCQD